MINKKINKFTLIFVAILSAFALVFGLQITKNNEVDAAVSDLWASSSFRTDSADKHEVGTQNVSLSTIKGYSKSGNSYTLNLYGGSSGTSATSYNYFSCHVDGAFQIGTGLSDANKHYTNDWYLNNGLKYKRTPGLGSIGLPSAGGCLGVFDVVFSLDDNLAYAIKNGTLNIQPSATITSNTSSTIANWTLRFANSAYNQDTIYSNSGTEADKIYINYEGAGVRGTLTSSGRIFKTYTDHSASVTIPNSTYPASGDLSRIGTDGIKIILQFVGYYSGSDSRDVSANFTNPTLKYTITDTTAPTMTTSVTNTNKARQVTLNFADTAGIDKVYIDNQEVYATKTNYTRNASYVFNATAGKASYSIRVVDNLGNTYNGTYNNTGYYTVNQVLNDTNALTSLTNATVTFGSSSNYTNIPFSITLGDIEYRLYKIFVTDGEIREEKTLAENLEFTAYSNTVVELQYRKVIFISFVNTTNGITVSNTANIDTTIQYFDSTDTLLDSVDNVSYYTAHCFVDNAQYYAEPVDYAVVDIQTTSNTLEYSDEGIDFGAFVTINSPNGVDYSIQYKDSNNSIITPANYNSRLQVGAYTYLIQIDNAYYLKNKTSDFYTLEGDFNVEKKHIALNISDQTKVYDANAYEFNRDLGYNYNIVFDNEPINVGTYLATVTIDEISYCGETNFAVSIFPKTIYLNAEEKQSVYGYDLAELTYQASGIENSDIDSFVITLTTDADNQSIGEYNIEISYNADEITLNNYIVETQNSTYTIMCRDLIVTIDSSQSKLYGTNDPEFTYQIIDGQELSDGDANIVVIRQEGENAGQYTLYLSEDYNSNYNIEYIANSFTIKPLDIIAKVNNATKVYGESDPQFSVNTSIENVDLGIEFGRIQGEDAGRYKISIVSYSNPNYTVLALTGYLTIQAKNIEISAVDVSKNYGEMDPALSYTINGQVLNDDDLGVTLSRQKGEKVGKYAIKMTNYLNKNYKVSFVGKNYLTINKADLIVTAKDCTKIYGCRDDAFVYETSKEVTKSELRGKLSRDLGENVGEYQISLGTLSSECYNITFVPATLTIEPRELRVYYTAISKIYGSDDPEFIYSLSGVQFNDTIDLITAREQGEDAGDYLIRASLQNSNYTLLVQDEYLKILKADSFITISDAEFIYDGESKINQATLSCDGDITFKFYKNDEEVAQMIDFGTYKVQAIFAGNQNYNQSTATASLTISKVTPKLAVYRSNFVYNDGNIINPEIECELNYKIIFDDSATAGEVGVHGYKVIIVDDEGNQNYNYEEFRGTINIIQVHIEQAENTSVQFEQGDIDGEQVNLTLNEVADTTNAKFAIAGVNIDKVYEIKYDQSSDATIKVSLDYVAEDYSNILVYAYTEDGNGARLVNYQIEDGKLVFSMDAAENVKFAIAQRATEISLVTIGIIGLITLVVLGFTGKTVRKKTKRVKFKIK